MAHLYLYIFYPLFPSYWRKCFPFLISANLIGNYQPKQTVSGMEGRQCIWCLLQKSLRTRKKESSKTTQHYKDGVNLWEWTLAGVGGCFLKKKKSWIGTYMYLATFGEMSQSDQAVFLPYSFNTHINYSYRECLLSCYPQNPSKLTSWLLGLSIAHFTSMINWPLQVKSTQTNFQVTLRNPTQRLNSAPTRKGEMMQLYCNLRNKNCKRLLKSPWQTQNAFRDHSLLSRYS